MRFAATAIFIITVGGLEAQVDAALVDKLDSMAKADQHWRSLVVDVRNGEVDSISFKQAFEGMVRVDTLNHPLLVDIFNTYGYPGYALVGYEGAHNFWVLIQHQDRFIDFQKQVLPAMKAEVEKNNAPKHDYAYLVDRVMLKTDSVQIYGSQMTLNADSSSFTPRPLRYPKKLDSLRQSVDLPPIEEYIHTMNERNYGTLKSK